MKTASEDDILQDVNMASSFKGPPKQTLETGTGLNGYKTTPPGSTASTHDHDPTASFSSSPSIGALSEDFERVLSDNPMNEGGNTSLQHNVDLDRPEISMQIRNVEQALQSLSEGIVTSEITTHLSQIVPKIIRLERKVKMQSTLRGIFEEENQQLKSQIEQMKDDRDNMNEENRKLQEEVVELKRAKEDEQLGGFDFVTKKEASEIKDAEKKETEKQHTATSTGAISEETHFNLQRKYLSLKKQIEEIVKVNHSWDEHYRNMKAQLEARLEDLQKQLDDAKNQTLMKQAGDDKAKDDILVQAKTRIEKAEKERAGALAEVYAVNQKCEKLERYARTLTGQRNEMEREIKRLNEALAQKMTRSLAQSAGTHATQGDPAQGFSPSTSLQGHNDQSVVVGTQKGVQDMTEPEMREEIELLRQQTEVFQSDFTHERHDRQRIMGELDVIQKELRRTKRQLKHDQQVMYEDTHLAQQLQREQQRDRQYSTSAPPRDYGYYVYGRPPVRYSQPFFPQESGRLIAHGKGKRTYNLAGNDMFIDGDTQTDGEPRLSLEYNQAFNETTTPPLNQHNRICPRTKNGGKAAPKKKKTAKTTSKSPCERSFGNDPDYHVHINACMDD